jgi:flagellar hook assembly protein FlgD
LASAGRARLSVYDVTGRLVRVVRDQEWPAGEHVVEWNGRTDAGAAAAGIYFVRFEAGERRQTERVVFLGSSR